MARRGRPSSNPDDDKTDIHIIMQLRKCVILGEKIVDFRNGDQHLVTGDQAEIVLSYYNAIYYPNEKFEYQAEISSAADVFISEVEELTYFGRPSPQDPWS